MSTEKLIELQGIDTKLRDLDDLLGDLPSKVKGLNDQEESINKDLGNNEKRLKELEVETNKREVDIIQINEKISTLKDQLFLVTNNKQYDAIMSEIDFLKGQKSTFENETISLLEEKDNIDLHGIQKKRSNLIKTMIRKINLSEDKDNIE